MIFHSIMYCTEYVIRRCYGPTMNKKGPVKLKLRCLSAQWTRLNTVETSVGLRENIVALRLSEQLCPH